jgi:hypothetical protein
VAGPEVGERPAARRRREGLARARGTRVSCFNLTDDAASSSRASI